MYMCMDNHDSVTENIISILTHSDNLFFRMTFNWSIFFICGCGEAAEMVAQVICNHGIQQQWQQLLFFKFLLFTHSNAYTYDVDDHCHVLLLDAFMRFSSWEAKEKKIPHTYRHKHRHINGKGKIPGNIMCLKRLQGLGIATPQ